MAARFRASARRCWLLVAVLLSLWISNEPRVPQPAAAQGSSGQQFLFIGTVLDSAGAPPPALSTVQLVLPTPPGSPRRPRSCASGATDATGGFQIVLFAVAVGCTVPGITLQLRVNDIPATQPLIIPPGPGTYTVFFSLAVPLGGQPLHLSGQGNAGTALRTTALAAGCSQVVLALGAGANPTQVAADVANPSTVIAIWRYDNALQRFAAYFADPSVPSDLTSLAALDTVFVCVSTATSITAP